MQSNDTYPRGEGLTLYFIWIMVSVLHDDFGKNAKMLLIQRSCQIRMENGVIMHYGKNEEGTI